MSQSEAAPDVTVVIVSYNALDWLPRSLSAIDAARRASTRRVEVVVVDNASEEPVRRYLADRPYGIRLVQLAQNVGFAGGCWAGAQAAHGSYLLFVNPDAVLQPGAIDALVEFSQADPRRGIIGGRTLRPDGGLEPHSCWAKPTLWSWWCAAVGLTSLFRGSRIFDPEAMGSWERDTEREVDIVTGCLLLIRRSTWDALGGFDRDFFMYGEDADLSLRARRSGLRPSITPRAVAVHAGGASSGNRLAKQRLLLRGKATLALKTWSPGRARVGVWLLVMGVGLRAAAEVVTRSRSTTWRTLWRERRAWSRGYPPAAASTPAEQRASA